VYCSLLPLLPIDRAERPLVQVQVAVAPVLLRKVPPLRNVISVTPRYHDHVPTILLQELTGDVSCTFAAGRFG
jgi:hypothetical protein